MVSKMADPMPSLNYLFIDGHFWPYHEVFKAPHSPSSWDQGRITSTVFSCSGVFCRSRCTTTA